MTRSPLLELAHLSISFGGQEVVHDVSLTVRPGERVALVGESGSGKTVTALSILRLLREAKLRGSVRFRSDELTSKDEAAMRRVRGSQIAMIFQEPMTALNPLYTVGAQIEETLRAHEPQAARQARAQAVALLARTGVRDPEHKALSYPHQLSGGERQRAMIAMALACRPQLLIADEPTTALDVSLRARIVQLLLSLQEEESQRADGQGMAILLITHDLPLVRRFAQRVAVMERGRLVEVGPTSQVFERPQHPYTKRLLDSAPVRRVAEVPETAPVLLSTQALKVAYRKPKPGLRGWFSSEPVLALHGAELVLRAGETVGVVGESGSGKSTLAQAILGLIPSESGEIEFEGTQLKTLQADRRRRFRARLQVVFQDPFGSLSPRHTVHQIIGEGLSLHFPGLDTEARERAIVSVLEDVGLPLSALHCYPHEFSGGQRQRIAIARALVLKPRVVVLDEPTSALDLSIQRQVIDLLVDLQRKYGLSYLLISHDLAVVRAMAHRIYVMKDGKIVEAGETINVIERPQHAYTRALIQASM